MSKKVVSNNEILLTAEGLKKLQEEYNYLTSVRRKEMVSSLTNALEQESSLVGNNVYDQALEERDKLELRVSELEEMFSLAKVNQDTLQSKVSVGITVVVEVEGERETYTIVGSAEVDGSTGKISYESPLGGALLGKSVGDSIVIEVPAGKLSYKIVSLE